MLLVAVWGWQHSSIASAQEAGGLQLQGIKLVEPINAPPPPVDVARVVQQQARKCGDSSGIRFGDVAPMRDTIPATDWSRGVRSLVAAAAVTDDRQQAYQLLDEALEAVQGDDIERRVVENIYLMTALQFRDFTTFSAKRDAFDSGEVRGPLLADRLFMDAFTAMHLATGTNWSKVEELATQAVVLDPLFFSARLLRLEAWLRREQAGGGAAATCDESTRFLSNLALDVSATSACPVLIAHVDHYLSRRFQSQSLPRKDSRLQPHGVHLWRAFVVAVLAAATNNKVVYESAKSSIKSLAEYASSSTCAPSVLAATEAIPPQ